MWKGYQTALGSAVLVAGLLGSPGCATISSAKRCEELNQRVQSDVIWVYSKKDFKDSLDYIKRWLDGKIAGYELDTDKMGLSKSVIESVSGIDVDGIGSCYGNGIQGIALSYRALKENYKEALKWYRKHNHCEF